MPRGKIISIKYLHNSLSQSSTEILEEEQQQRTDLKIIGFLEVTKRKGDKKIIKKREQLPIAIEGEKTLDFDIELDKTEVTFEITECGRLKGFKGNMKLATNLKLYQKSIN